MSCDAPPPTDGGTFSCAGVSSNFGVTCNLECESGRGYAGDTQITCDVDNRDGTVSWSSIPTCTGQKTLDMYEISVGITYDYFTIA